MYAQQCAQSTGTNRSIGLICSSNNQTKSTKTQKHDLNSHKKNTDVYLSTDANYATVD